MTLLLSARILSRSRLAQAPLRARWASTTSASPQPPRSRLARFGRAIGLGSVAVATFGALTFAEDAWEGSKELKTLRARSGERASRERTLDPLGALLRTYVVYSFCSWPSLVDWAPATLDAAFAVPGLRSVAERVVRATFFGQFVGGDTAEDALPLIEELRAQNVGCLFAYSVEVDEAAASGQGHEEVDHATSVHKQIVNETLHCIDVAADYEDKQTSGLTGRRTWVAIKLSAMVPDAETLRRLSQYLVDTRPRITPPVAFPGCPLPSDLDVLQIPRGPSPLSETDVAVLRELREDLIAICERAQSRGVRIIFDAEYSWYEPAIDAFTLDMMRRFNKLPVESKKSWFGSSGKGNAGSPGVQPLVYATYQAYLRRTPEYLAQSIEDARKEGYSIGVKLVRGAYHPHEVAAHPSAKAGAHSLSISPDAEPPVWTTKEDTDARYNACVRTLVGAVKADVEASKGARPPTIGVLFGTHNWESADLIPEELVRQGAASKDEDGTIVVGADVAERVTMGQLFGMTAALTNYLVDRIRSPSPFVIKYIPYGALSEVMPYLGRRAIENKSVLGNGAAKVERQRAAAEIVAKVLG